MKTLQKKNLTQNQMINKLLVANTQLSDKVNDKDTFIDLIEHLYSYSHLTKADLHNILYEIFEINKNLNRFDEQTVLTIAKLGFEHEQILHSNFVDVKRYFADHYLHLDTLLKDENEEVRNDAKRQLVSFDRMTNSSESMQQLFNALNLRNYLSVYCITDEHYHVIVYKPVIWSSLDEGPSMMITANKNNYDVRIYIDEPITHNFTHDVFVTLDQYGFTSKHGDIESITLMNQSMRLDALIDFVDWFFTDSI